MFSKHKCQIILYLFKILVFTIFVYLQSTNIALAKDDDDVFSTLKDIVENLTCETKGVGNLLRSEFSHTCIPAPFFTFAVANILSPGEYADTVLKLKLRDKYDSDGNHELFKGKHALEFPTEDACSRSNRVDFYVDKTKEKLSFALCNNIQLQLTRVENLAESFVAIAKGIVTSEEPWDDIAQIWQETDESKYHTITTAHVGETGVNVDVVPVFWKVVEKNDRICLATIGFTGYIPVGCKYIKEPFPKSKYADFIDLRPSSNNQKNTNIPSGQNYTDPVALVTCAGASGCYRIIYNNSQSSLVISGPLVECIKQMVTKVMINDQVCSSVSTRGDFNSGTPIGKESMLYKFQVNMHQTVSALLAIYIIFFGFKMILKGDVPSKAELFNFLLKFIFVAYFSIGININTGENAGRYDGMTQLAIPFLLGGMSELMSWVMNASPSQLCYFDPTSYPKGLSYISIWDSLDCKLTHYLGIDVVQTMVVNHQFGAGNFSHFDPTSYPIPPYIYLLVPAFISGNATLVMLALMYPLLVISVAAFIINATIICIISIVILSILAPVFVPMYLFNFTKSYFEGWLKLLISFMLQPMVAIAFMTTMLAVYDYGFYGTCNYVADTYTLKGDGLTGNSVDSERKVKIFRVDTDWDAYPGDEVGKTGMKKSVEDCKNSLGYMLNHPFDFLISDLSGKSASNSGASSSKGTDLSSYKSGDFPWLQDADKYFDKAKEAGSFVESIVTHPGLLFDKVELFFEKIKDMIVALLTACFVLYLMYHFSETLANFAADITEGVSVGNVSIKPQALFKAGLKAGGAAAGAMGGGGKDSLTSGSKTGKARDSLTTKSRSARGQDTITSKPSSKAASDSLTTRSDGSTSSKSENTPASDKFTTLSDLGKNAADNIASKADSASKEGARRSRSQSLSNKEKDKDQNNIAQQKGARRRAISAPSALGSNKQDKTTKDGGEL